MNMGLKSKLNSFPSVCLCFYATEIKCRACVNNGNPMLRMLPKPSYISKSWTFQNLLSKLTNTSGI